MWLLYTLVHIGTRTFKLPNNRLHEYSACRAWLRCRVLARYKAAPASRLPRSPGRVTPPLPGSSRAAFVRASTASTPRLNAQRQVASQILLTLLNCECRLALRQMVSC